jgi:hypothetical protein
MPLAPSAAPLDGAAPIVCTGTDVRECEAGAGCPRQTSEDVNLPSLVRIDVKEKMLSGLGTEQPSTTPIHAIERRDGRLVMYGGQEGVAGPW